MATEQGLLQLAKLFRDQLLHSDKRTIELQEELILVENYLNIEKLRFGDELVVVWDIDKTTQHLNIPPRILQPLVENAIRHGVSMLPQRGKITIGTAYENHLLHLWVLNDGPVTLRTRSKKGNRVALNDLKEKLFYCMAQTQNFRRNLIRMAFLKRTFISQ